MKKKFIFISVITAQLIFLSCAIYLYTEKINKAPKIVLETEPVDPFSVFRGRYIALRYKISNMPDTIFKDCNASDVPEGSPIYVVLQQKDKFWEAVSAYKNKPKGTNQVYLKGKRFYSYQGNVRVTYGIESFFLSESSADEIDRGGRPTREGWQEIQRARDERLGNLSLEEKRIYKARITIYWLEILGPELDSWVQEGLISQESAAEIKEKYKKALERIDAALQITPRNPQGQDPNQALAVEVAVTKGGIGYPTRLFWKGKEYR